MSEAALHHWHYAELKSLFYDALLRDARSENYTAEKMDDIAGNAASSAANYIIRTRSNAPQQPRNEE